MLRSTSFHDPFNTAHPKGVEREIQDLACLTACISGCGLYLAAACVDNSIIIYSLQTFSRVAELYSEELSKFKIKSIQFNAAGDEIVCLLETNMIVLWNCLSASIVGEPVQEQGQVVHVDFLSGELMVVLASGEVRCGKRRMQLDISPIHVCQRAQDIFILTSESSLVIVDGASFAIKGIFNEAELGAAEHGGFTAVACSSSGQDLILTGRNRSLRVVSIVSGVVILRLKLQDVVDKFNWKSTGFSQHSTFDSSFIFAAAAAKGRHLVNIWECSTGNLIHRLEGPKEEAAQALWNPIKPQVYSVGLLTGKIYVWGPQFPQKWAALVPNIEAIETNIEYIEREDEFDLTVEEELEATRERDEAIELDLASFEPQKGVCVTRYPLCK